MKPQTFFADSAMHAYTISQAKHDENASKKLELIRNIIARSSLKKSLSDLPNKLAKTFTSLGEIANAPASHLLEFEGMTPTIIGEFKLAEAAALYYLRMKITKNSLEISWDNIVEYCLAAMAYGMNEQFRILYFNQDKAFIDDEVQQIGTINHTPVYPRKIVANALENKASYIILAHNHPSGDPTPSLEDISMTRSLCITAKLNNIEIYDHLIIAREGYASLRKLDLME